MVYEGTYTFTTEDGKFGVGYNCNPSLCEKSICCKKDKDLFLAIASITDDDDRNQFFCDWDYRFWKNIEKYYIEDTKHGEHKATPDELINYFKNKK
jgi:hypothetical protein